MEQHPRLGQDLFDASTEQPRWPYGTAGTNPFIAAAGSPSLSSKPWRRRGRHYASAATGRGVTVQRTRLR